MLEWFPKSSPLETYLDKLGQPPSNFDPEQPIDSTWHVDQHEVPLGPDHDGLFARAVDSLLRYQFYPPSVMHFTGDFVRENRQLRFGDRVLQRIHVIPGVLDTVTMNRVTSTLAEPNRIGFTYTTTEHQLEMGEWTATVLRKRDGQVALVMYSVSKSGPKMPGWAKPFARTFQLRAHRLGMEYFRLLVQSGKICN